MLGAVLWIWPGVTPRGGSRRRPHLSPDARGEEGQHFPLCFLRRKAVQELGHALQDFEFQLAGGWLGLRHGFSRFLGRASMRRAFALHFLSVARSASARACKFGHQMALQDDLLCVFFTLPSAPASPTVSRWPLPLGRLTYKKRHPFTLPLCADLGWSHQLQAWRLEINRHIARCISWEPGPP